MGEYTFNHCLSLATVTIGNGLEIIPDHAFAQCRALTTLQIGDAVTTIDKYAFSMCEVLPSVQLPNSLTSIKEGAFQSCAALATVTIPAGVTSITELAFTYCTNLTRVIMLGNTPPDLLDDSGVPISSSNKQWKPFFSYSGDQAYKFNGEISVPAGSESTYASNTSWVGYASKVAPRREVTLSVNNKGTISSDQIYTIDSTKYATVGKEVTINGMPNSGFALTDLTVTKSDSTTVDVSGTGNTRTFTMPDDSVTINAVFSAPLTDSNITVENLTYNGSDQAIVVKLGTTTLTANTDYTVEYEQNNAAVTPHNAGEYTATITGAGDFGGTVNKTFTIEKAPLTVAANDKSITYGDAPANAGVTYSGFVGSETVAVLSGTLGYTYNYSQYGNVGSYTITPGGYTSDNYAITFSPGTLTVNKADATLTTPPVAIDSLTYTGLAQELVAAVSATGGTMKYYAGKVDPDKPSTAPADESLYTTSIPTAAGAGTYYVSYRVIGDANHNSVDPQGVYVTIAKATRSDVTASGAAKYGENNVVDISTMIISGGKVGTITVTDGDGTLSGNPSYDSSTGKVSFSFTNNEAKAGKTATITVPVTSDNYNDYNIVITVTVTSKSVISPSVAISDWTYGQNAKTPVVTGNTANGAKSLKTIKLDITKSITVEKGAFGKLNTKKMTIKVSSKMSKKELKKFKKILKKAGYKGKVKRG